MNSALQKFYSLFDIENKENRVLFSLFTLILPWTQVLFVYNSFWDQVTWQSGNFVDYVLLFSTRLLPFIIPLLAGASVAQVALLYDYKRFSQNALIRFFIYLGAAYSAVYSLIALLYGIYFLITPDSSEDSIFSFFLPLFFIISILSAPKVLAFATESKFFTLKKFLFFILGLIFIQITVSVFRSDFYTSYIVFFPLQFLISFLTIWLFFATPVLALTLTLCESIKLGKSENNFMIFAIFITKATATISAATKTISEYSQLPTTAPPECYIATAAACGYPSIVNSWTVGANKSVFRVNAQLQRLKVLEILLRNFNPSIHKIIRTHYDHWGKITAQKITHPLVATLVYFSLKPLELVSYIMIKMVGLEKETKRLWSFEVKKK